MEPQFFPEDETLIQRLTCKQEMPKGFLMIYWVELKAWHRTGGSGPLPRDFLHMLLHMHGHTDVEGLLQGSQASDWSRIENGARVKIDLQSRGTYNGVFKGVPESGKAAVVLDGHQSVDLFPFSMVEIDDSGIDPDLGIAGTRHLMEAQRDDSEMASWLGVEEGEAVVVSVEGKGNRNAEFVSIEGPGMLRVKYDGNKTRTSLASVAKVSLPKVLQESK